MIIRHAPVAVDLVQTRCTVNRLGGKISRAIKGEQVVAVKEHQRFEHLAALQLPKDALEHWAWGLRGHRIEYLPHLRVARNASDAVDRPSIALGPLLVKGKQRRRFERKHSERRHERIR